MANPSTAAAASVLSPLNSLLAEIEAADPEMAPPTGDPSTPNQKEIAAITDPWLRKLYSLFCTWREQVERLELDEKFERDPARKTALEVEATALASKTDLLRSIFWHIVSTHHNTWNLRGLQLRTGWRLYESPATGLESIFGGAK